MTGRVLIVDPVVTTRIVLKVKLAAAYFTVNLAANMREATEEASKAAPDVVLCEHELSDGGAALLQKRLARHNIPVIALLPEGSDAKRAEALEAGLGDVISRPYDNRTLLARIRNLLRARTTNEELRLRSDTSAALGFAEAADGFGQKARIGLLAETAKEGVEWKTALEKVLPHEASVLSPADLVSENGSKSVYDALLVGISGRNAQHRLDFVSSLRARTQTRHTAIMAVAPRDTADLAITALDTGAGDVMASGFEAKEAAQRLTRLLRRRAQEKALRRSVKAGLEAAVTDPLTGLYNRRYAIPYLDRMSASAKRSQRCFALMLLDLDHFKRVNDEHGHAVGDIVLVEFAHRLRCNLRSMDLVARLGGEEFLVAMPDTSLDQAASVAARLCELTRAHPFAADRVAGGVSASVSVGLALGGSRGTAKGEPLHTNISQLLEQADHALYDAKEAGRDMVRVCQS
ncbi:MAG: diguanylate cyclase, partial [Pseudomonadota bacterium]